MGPFLPGRIYHRLSIPHHRVPPVPRARIRLMADRSRGLRHVRGPLAGAPGPIVFLRPHRRIIVPRNASAEVHALRRWTEGSWHRGRPRHHLERGRDRRDARRALLRGARLAFRLTGAFFFRGAFLAGAFFGGGCFFGGRAFPGGFRGGAFIATSLLEKGFSPPPSRAFIPASLPRAAPRAVLCFGRTRSTVCAP